MRIILTGFVLFITCHIGLNAIASVNQLQEQRAEQMCQIDSSLCGQ